MISLNVYLTAKAGREAELGSLIRDGWLAAMAKQPGFLSAAVLKPFPDDELARLGAVKPAGHFEVIAFWRSEAERKAWVARPVHDRVFNPVAAASHSFSYTLHTVEQSWKL